MVVRIDEAGHNQETAEVNRRRVRARRNRRLCAGSYGYDPAVRDVQRG